MEKIKIICVVGATASGKTSLGVELAKALNGEIVSADSMQVYKNMPIATALATDEEQQGIKHHLLGILNPDETFSVADFVILAKNIIFDIANRGKVPIIVGGTGLFVDSLVNNISFSDVSANDDLRLKLQQKTNDELYAELLKLDANSAKSIHKNNRKRVIRALELYYGGTSKTQQNENSVKNDNPFSALYIGINYKNRQNLYNRINLRVDNMIENGIVDEARQNLQLAGKTARQAIGHKELKPYIDGQISLDTAVENLKKETRHYAKRQLTWFRKNQSINWLYADELKYDDLIKQAILLSNNFLNSKKGGEYETNN